MINFHMIFALVMATFVGGIAGYIGSLMVTKRMALMGGALGHLTMPGIALALFFNIDVSLGALGSLFFGIVLIWLFERKTHLPFEALTAVVFASSLAVTFLFLPQEKTAQALIGDISQVSFRMAAITIILSVGLYFLIKKIYSGLILMSVSSDIASSLRIRVKRYNLIYLMSIALVIALGVKIVGGLMTAALVAIPACTSKYISKSLLQYSYGSMLFGGLSCFLGMLIFMATNIPAGPLIIICSSLLFLCSLLFKNRAC